MVFTKGKLSLEITIIVPKWPASKQPNGQQVLIYDCTSLFRVFMIENLKKDLSEFEHLVRVLTVQNH
jgi:hypothetical protein